MADQFESGRRLIGPYEVGAPAPDPADRRLGTVAFIFLFGYLVLGRSFAQIGLPSANVFLGEILLVAAILTGRLRSGLTGALQALVQAHPLHVMTWSAFVFVLYGLFQVALVAKAGGDLLGALKIFAFHYYVVFIFIGLRLGLLVPDLLERTCRFVPFGVAGFLALSIANVDFSLPLSASKGLFTGSGAPIVMMLMITLEREFLKALPAFAICTFQWLYLQIRGDWLGVGAAVIVWGAVTRRLRLVLACLTACVLLFLLLDLLGIRISASADRGGAVGGKEIIGRVVAPFDPELGEKLVPDADVFAGTARWRQDFWADISEAVNASESTRLFGLGYGRPLSELTNFVESDTRSPHNVFYFALGYGGWLCVAIFAIMNLCLVAALWKAFKATGRPFGLMLWIFGLLAGLFGNFFETPYNSVPFYVLLGISLAPVVRSYGWPLGPQRASSVRGDIPSADGPGQVSSIDMSPP